MKLQCPCGAVIELRPGIETACSCGAHFTLKMSMPEKKDNPGMHNLFVRVAALLVVLACLAVATARCGF